MKKVGYDAQALLIPSGGTGKGKQLQNLLGPFADRFLGFASTDRNVSGLPLIQHGFAGYSLWQQVSLPRLLSRYRIDLFLAPANVAPRFVPRKTDVILVLHDMIYMQGFRKPDLKGRLMDAYRRWQIRYSVRRARIVLTVSQHARGEILEMFPRADVRVIPCSVPEIWFAPRPLNERPGYLLMTTSSAPHKNSDGGIKGFAEYARIAGPDARPLRIIGMGRQAAGYQPFLEQNNIAHLVTFLPFQSETEMIEQYRGAAALLFPSFAEGFGIPMLEAMATGTPIIAANTTSLPEVGGAAARYFDPYNIHEMAIAIKGVLEDDALREQMALKGFAELERYAPAQVQAQVIAFWEEIAKLTSEDLSKAVVTTR